MKEHTSVSNGWLVERLGMGSGVYIGNHVGIAQAVRHPAGQQITKVKRGESDHFGMITLSHG